MSSIRAFSDPDDLGNLFARYYSSQTFKRRLWLPDHPSQHHYRFQYCNSSSKSTFRRVRKVVRTKEILTNITLREKPCGIYFTPLRWLDPINVRRSGGSVSDFMLSSPLYLDIDKTLLSDKSLRSALATTINIIEYLVSEYDREPELIVFSGRNGFHLYYWNWDSIVRSYGNPKERLQNFRIGRKHLVSILADRGMVVDSGVTTDPWRVLRLPGSLHPETGLVATTISQVQKFAPLHDCLGFDLEIYRTKFKLNMKDYELD